MAPTPRQAEVIRLMMRGMRRCEIATALCISPKTVDAHLAHIQNAGDATPGAGMVAYAIAHDLVPADCPLGEALAAWEQRRG